MHFFLISVGLSSKVTGWAILEESQGDGAEETRSLTRTPWVARGSTEAGQQARYLGKVWSGQGSYWGEP